MTCTNLASDLASVDRLRVTTPILSLGQIAMDYATMVWFDQVVPEFTIWDISLERFSLVGNVHWNAKFFSEVLIFLRSLFSEVLKSEFRQGKNLTFSRLFSREGQIFPWGSYIF